MPTKDHNYCVYMMTNKNNSVLYTGVTNNLERRVYEHRHKTTDGFTAKYNCIKLVYFECGSSIEGAIEREKQIKGWLRSKKDALVVELNPNWNDLSTSS